MELFVKIKKRLEATNYFYKELYLRCLTTTADFYKQRQADIDKKLSKS